MPWLDAVGGVVEAWYGGTRGGEAIAAVLFGDVNPSGRLPITFPRSLSKATGFDVPHDEGSDVGYRWFARREEKALFPFGHGLSYTTFGYSDLQVRGARR